MGEDRKFLWGVCNLDGTNVLHEYEPFLNNAKTRWLSPCGEMAVDDMSFKVKPQKYLLIPIKE